MNIYCFSGLGADESVFEHLSISNTTLHFVPWLAPLKNETLEAYARRLGNSVDFESPYSFMGLSFGGMIAYELASVFSPAKTFLISSALSGKEVNRALRLAGKLQLQRLIPSFLLKQPHSLVYYFFGLKTREEKKLFRGIMKNTSPDLLRWAMSAIVNWQPKRAADVIRIHGTKDLIIPFPKAGIDLKIEGGTHFCILQQADVISFFLESQVQK